MLFKEGRWLFWRSALSVDGRREQGAYYSYSENFDKWYKVLLPEESIIREKELSAKHHHLIFGEKIKRVTQ